MANVFHFGARGDGVTDDTAALQHALDAGDGVLRLAKGTYRITRPLVLDLARQGYGGARGESGASRIVMAGPGPALRIIGDHRGSALPRSVQPHTWDRERFPQVTGLEIVGEHPDAVGIELRRTMKCTITEVLVRRCRVGIHLVERNRDFILANSHLYDNREIGLFFDHCNLHQIIVQGNHISWNRVAGIKSLNGDVHNLQIVGNDIEYNNLTAALGANLPADEPALADHAGGAEIWFAALAGVISEVTIAGNTIQATVQRGGANVRITGTPVARSSSAADGGQPDTAHLISITGNVLGSQWRGVDLRYASRVTITGNTLYDAADLSVYAAHVSGLTLGPNTIGWRCRDSDPPQEGLYFEDCENVVISQLATQRMSAGSPASGAAVTLVRCRDSSICDCQLLDPVHCGIELQDCERCRVVNNTVVDRRAPPTFRAAIRLRGRCRNNLVAGNLVGGGNGPWITVEGAGDPTQVRENLTVQG